jgi:hypothetical protein
MRFMLIYKVALGLVLLVSNRRVGKGGYGTGLLQTLASSSQSSGELRRL